MHWDSRGGHQVLVLAVDIEVSFILFGSRVRIVNPAFFLNPSHRALWVSRALLRGDLPFTILKASLPRVSPRGFVGRLISSL